MTTTKKSTTMAKRVPPVIRIRLPKGLDIREVYNKPQIREVILTETVSAISEGILRNKKSVILFRIGDSDFDTELCKDKWKYALKSALDFILDKEELESGDYLKCADIRNMINKLK